MKRKAALLLAGMLVCSAALAGCSGGNQASNDYVTVGGYKGIEVDKVEDQEEVTDEDIDNYIASVQQQNAQEVTDRPVQEGDIANIDFVGKMDGQEFDGGSGQGYDLTIGSGQFIDGFEDGLIGKEVGTTVDLPLTFPDPYTNPDLAGQDVVFEVTIHAIVEHVTPEWNDEFASEHTGYDTAAAYEESLRESLQQQKEESAVSQRQYEAMQAVIADSEFECSEEELQSLRDSRTQEYETYASYYGLELDDFLLQAMQMSREDFDSEVESWAEFQLKCTLAVDAIAKAENITVTEEEYQAGLETLAEEYGAESAEAFEEQYGRGTVENSLIYDKVVDFVTEQAVEI